MRTILVGIDVEVGEIVLAERLREKRRLDLVLTHHPEGRALAKLGDVMGMQADILNAFGVPIATAEGILGSRIAEVSRRLLPVNHTRAVDAARLLGLPFMCVHTPGDNIALAQSRGAHIFWCQQAKYALGGMDPLPAAGQALREMMMAVKNQAPSDGPEPVNGSQWLARSYARQSLRDLEGARLAARRATEMSAHFRAGVDSTGGTGIRLRASRSGQTSPGWRIGIVSPACTGPCLERISPERPGTARSGRGRL